MVDHQKALCHVCRFSKYNIQTGLNCSLKATFIQNRCSKFELEEEELKNFERLVHNRSVDFHLNLISPNDTLSFTDPFLDPIPLIILPPAFYLIYERDTMGYIFLAGVLLHKLWLFRQSNHKVIISGGGLEKKTVKKNDEPSIALFLIEMGLIAEKKEMLWTAQIEHEIGEESEKMLMVLVANAGLYEIRIPAGFSVLAEKK